LKGVDVSIATLQINRIDIFYEEMKYYLALPYNSFIEKSKKIGVMCKLRNTRLVCNLKAFKIIGVFPVFV